MEIPALNSPGIRAYDFAIHGEPMRQSQPVGLDITAQIELAQRLLMPLVAYGRHPVTSELPLPIPSNHEAWTIKP